MWTFSSAVLKIYDWVVTMKQSLNKDGEHEGFASRREHARNDESRYAANAAAERHA